MKLKSKYSLDIRIRKIEARASVRLLKLKDDGHEGAKVIWLRVFLNRLKNDIKNMEL